MSYETASDYPEGLPRIPQIKAVGPEMADDPVAALRAAPPAGTRSPAGLGRLRPGDLIAGTGSLLVLISLFLPWYSFAASAAHAPATAAVKPEVMPIKNDKSVVAAAMPMVVRAP